MGILRENVAANKIWIGPRRFAPGNG